MALSDVDSSDSDDAHSDTHGGARSQESPAPLSNPDASHKLTNNQYDYLDDLLDDLDDYGDSASFAVYKIRSVNYVKGFGTTRVDLGRYKGKIRTFKAYSRNTWTTK